MALGGCGDSGHLTRAEAERILNGEGRGYVCVTRLGFTEEGFKKVKASNLIDRTTSKVADAPDGDRWLAFDRIMGDCDPLPNFYCVKRMKHPRRCLDGKADILAIADAPFAIGSGSYKVVDYVEIVTPPPELKHIEAFMDNQYAGSIVFQKTDRGWRVKPQ
jgi:hypothetical protein